MLFQAYAAVGWTQRHSEEGGKVDRKDSNATTARRVCRDGNVVRTCKNFSIVGEDKKIAPNYHT